MRLGEMLIRDGRLQPADLDRIIAQQQQEGGRIGSLLVQAGLVDAETLTVYLGLELGIPIATGATFERCKRSAVRLLSPEQASRFRCIPIVIQGQTLIVAVDDPHDMMTLDRISQETGYRVIPRVAPEIRIYYYLERFYGVPQPHRFKALGDQRGNLQAQHQGLPAPPLPGLPPKVAKPTIAPTPAPALQAKPSEAPPAPEPTGALPTPASFVEDTGEHEALELDAADLVEELDSDDAELAGAAPIADADAAPKPKTAKASEERPKAIGAEEAIERIETTQLRGEIADAILGHAAELFETATLLLVRANLAFGWRGFGPGLDSERIETMLVPLDVPSMFQAALHEDNEEHLFNERPLSTPLHNHWYKLLRTQVPATGYVVVCYIGRRPVNLLYGHTSGGKAITALQLDDLQRVMQAASEAYVRLISKSKREHKAATMAPAFGMANEGDGEAEGDGETEDDTAPEATASEDGGATASEDGGATGSEDESEH